ncbi:MAG TPA: hypothetical protein VME43_14500 [Bryobacteraceae bacterium]|nr:hypothetical protein [Bryobacteraceae bacterium]
MNRRLRRWAWWVGPCVVCLLAHSHALGTWFRADDFAWLNLAARVQNFHDLPAALFTPRAEGTIRPLGDRGFFLALYTLFGLNALPFHVVALATQFANLALAAWIGARLTGSRAAGWWAAVFWGVNSVLVEPLGWVCVYDQVLWGFFVLVAFQFRLRYLETTQRRYAVCEWIAFLLGFGALELNVMYPALVALYNWSQRARRGLRSTLAMFGVSVAYAAVHLVWAPGPRTGSYAMHFTGSAMRTLWTYVTWSVGPTLLWTPYRAPRWLPAAGVVMVLLGLAVFAAARRDTRVVWFCLGWYVLALAPVLPLRDHVTEYYPYLALVGLCWLGGWAVAECWRSGGRARVAAAALAAVYAVLVVPRTVAGDAWNYRMSLRVRNLVEGVAGARQRHPREAILLDGVDTDLFYNGVVDHAFALLGNQIYLAPGCERAIAPFPGKPSAAEFVLPGGMAAKALAEQQAVVYDVRGARLQNITARYTVSQAERQAPARVEVAQPLAAYLLGPEWYAPEGNHRWMPRRATLRIAGPAAPGQKLYLDGSCPPEQLRQGPLAVTVTVDGAELGTRAIAAGPGTFELAFRLPAEALGKPEMSVEIAVSRTFRAPGDARDLGLAVGSVEVR